ncbi:hypothetical protein L0B52_01685 [Suttonella sp. R2A3]|uniref:XAC2610-related protein n=1 Tax=Suttonella sp. R2A3 TaxID=2908648 RepID=UPI001F1A53B6|nr:hypothetical protein [Suttonella sp. R2A3]UJF24875.1 hypothetical protein L0B52_01685 [Suttonella sp. R2A3]
MNVKKLTLLVSFIFSTAFSSAAFSQVVYQISDFSDLYRGELTIPDDYADLNAKQGIINIYEKRFNQKIISTPFDGLVYLPNNEGTFDLHSLWHYYLDQPIVIYDDLNFDGKKDIAIMQSDPACSDKLAYLVYLETGNGLKLHEELSNLTKEYCMMFERDFDTQTIKVATPEYSYQGKSAEYKVSGDKLILLKLIEYTQNKDFVINNFTAKIKKGDGFEIETYAYINQWADVQDVHILNFKDGRVMRLIKVFSGRDYIMFTHTEADGKVITTYSGPFIYDTKRDVITFSQDGKDYQLFKDTVLVTTNNEQQRLEALPSEDADLTYLKAMRDDFANLEFR